MIQNWLLLLATLGAVWSYPSLFETKKFQVGVEYERSLPMCGGSDRYRHRNNYEPFFVTVTANAKTGYVVTYLEVTATVDAPGEVDFIIVRGQTGSYYMTFQLVSNHTDFLSYSYMAYGIKEEEYRKMANIITLPMTNNGLQLRNNGYTITTLLLTYLLIITL